MAIERIPSLLLFDRKEFVSIVKIDVIYRREFRAAAVSRARRRIELLLGSECERRFASETVEELLENKFLYFHHEKIHKRFHTDLVANNFF